MANFHKTQEKFRGDLEFHRSPPLEPMYKYLAKARPDPYGGKVSVVDVKRDAIPFSKSLKSRVVGIGSSPVVTGSPLIGEAGGGLSCAPRIQDNVELTIGKFDTKAVDFRLLSMDEGDILNMEEFAWIGDNKDMTITRGDRTRALRDAKITINKHNTDKVWAAYTTAKAEMDFSCRVEENLTLRIQALRWIVRTGICGESTTHIYTLDRLLAMVREDKDKVAQLGHQDTCDLLDTLAYAVPKTYNKDTVVSLVEKWYYHKIDTFLCEARSAGQNIVVIEPVLGDSDTLAFDNDGGKWKDSIMNDIKVKFNKGFSSYYPTLQGPVGGVWGGGEIDKILPLKGNPDAQLLFVEALLRDGDATGQQAMMAMDQGQLGNRGLPAAAKAAKLYPQDEPSMDSRDSAIGALLRFAAQDRAYSTKIIPAPAAAKAALARHSLGLPVGDEYSPRDQDSGTAKGKRIRDVTKTGQRNIHTAFKESVVGFVQVRNASFQSLIDSGYAGDCKSMGLAISVALEGSTALGIRRDHELAVILVEEGMAQGMMYDKGFRDTMQVLARKNLHLFSFRSKNPFHNVYAKVAGRVHSLRDTKSKRAEDWGRMHTRYTNRLRLFGWLRKEAMPFWQRFSDDMVLKDKFFLDWKGQPSWEKYNRHIQVTGKGVDKTNKGEVRTARNTFNTQDSPRLVAAYKAAKRLTAQRSERIQLEMACFAPCEMSKGAAQIANMVNTRIRNKDGHLRADVSRDRLRAYIEAGKYLIPEANQLHARNGEFWAGHNAAQHLRKIVKTGGMSTSAMCGLRGEKLVNMYCALNDVYRRRLSSHSHTGPLKSTDNVLRRKEALESALRNNIDWQGVVSKCSSLEEKKASTANIVRWETLIPDWEKIAQDAVQGRKNYPNRTLVVCHSQAANQGINLEPASSKEVMVPVGYLE